LALNYKATNEMVVISNFVTFVNSRSPEGATRHFLLHYPSSFRYSLPWL